MYSVVVLIIIKVVGLVRSCVIITLTTLMALSAIVVNPRLSIPKKKNIQTWNIMVTRQLNDNASMYVGVENIFGEKQDLRDIHGATYRMGLNLRM